MNASRTWPSASPELALKPVGAASAAVVIAVAVDAALTAAEPPLPVLSRTWRTTLWPGWEVKTVVLLVEVPCAATSFHAPTPDVG